MYARSGAVTDSVNVSIEDYNLYIICNLYCNLQLYLTLFSLLFLKHMVVLLKISTSVKNGFVRLRL